jgi:hypothetical protein
LLDGIQDVAEVRAKETVSLNIEERRKEREASVQRRFERENARRMALNLEPLENSEDMDELESPDIHLDQAAAIVTDLVRMREIEAAPARAAQILN